MNRSPDPPEVPARVRRLFGIAALSIAVILAALALHSMSMHDRAQAAPTWVRWGIDACAAALLCIVIIFIEYDRRLHRQQSRALRGQCLNCGYSLTGNVSGVCPECGTTVEAAEA